MYRTAILFKLLLVSLLYTMCGTVSKDFIPQELLFEACLHFEEMFPEKCEKARKAALNTQTSETTIKVPLTTSTSATTTEAPVLTTTTSETTTSVPITTQTSEVTTTGTTTSASTADPSTTQTSATTTTAPVTTPTSETTTSAAITPAAGTTEEKTARTSVSTSAARCLVTEGMDNPTVIPTDYLQQKPNFPSSDDVEKLRPGDEPFTINPSDTPINVTLKVSDEPVDLSEVKVLGTNVKEFKVFARRTPDGPLGLLTPVDPDSSDGSLTFLPGTLVTSVVVEVTPETGIEPVTLDVSLHACFEVTTGTSPTTAPPGTSPTTPTPGTSPTFSPPGTSPTAPPTGTLSTAPPTVTSPTPSGPSTTPRCELTEGMANPDVVPSGNLEQVAFFPSSDSPDNLREGGAPFVIHSSSTPVRVSIKLSDEPVYVAEVKLPRRDNVQEFIVYGQTSPDGEFSPVASVDGDSTDGSLRFPPGTLLTAIQVEVTPADTNQPMSIEVNVHACFEAPVTTITSETTKTGNTADITTQTIDTASTAPSTTQTTETSTTVPITTETSEVTTTETTMTAPTETTTTTPSTAALNTQTSEATSAVPSTTSTSVITTTAPVTTITSETTTSVPITTQTSEVTSTAETTTTAPTAAEKTAQTSVSSTTGDVTTQTSETASTGGVSPCDSSPCLNGGTCKVYEDGFYCICKREFIGRTCYRCNLGCPPIVMCSPDRVVNGGACSPGGICCRAE